MLRCDRNAKPGQKLEKVVWGCYESKKTALRSKVPPGDRGRFGIGVTCACATIIGNCRYGCGGRGWFATQVAKKKVVVEISSLTHSEKYNARCKQLGDRDVACGFLEREDDPALES